MKKANNTVAYSAEPVNRFETAIRNYETAYTSGHDYGEQLQTLAVAVAYSVINRCIDPQRKAAADRATVSDGGCSTVMQQLKRDVAASLSSLDNLRKASDAATRYTLTADGDPETETASKDAETAVAHCIRQTIGDGMDVVQEAAAAILEQSAAHADVEPGWMEKPYTVRRLSRRVYVRMDDSAAYRDDETTPIQEAYRAARLAVESSASVKADPESKFAYIDAETPDGLDTIYFRLGRYADMGGYAVHDRSHVPGAPAGLELSTDGLYTADVQTAMDYDAIIARLNLSARQMSVLKLRMQGYGKKAIGTALGVDPANVARTLRQIQKRCIEIGLHPGE